MVAFNTSPPSRCGNGGTSVPPPAKLIRRGARERMFIGVSQRSLSVDFRAVSQNPSPDQDGEVRLSEYAGRVIRNWYIVLATVVVARSEERRVGKECGARWRVMQLQNDGRGGEDE